uniref:Uncharacterized protein n=1 Tax=Triticum urartu TaxID=4572 RepID=A0A8R7U3V2_TRIUA
MARRCLFSTVQSAIGAVLNSALTYHFHLMRDRYGSAPTITISSSHLSVVVELPRGRRRRGRMGKGEAMGCGGRTGTGEEVGPDGGRTGTGEEVVGPALTGQ